MPTRLWSVGAELRHQLAEATGPVVFAVVQSLLGTAPVLNSASQPTKRVANSNYAPARPVRSSLALR